MLEEYIRQLVEASYNDFMEYLGPLRKQYPNVDVYRLGKRVREVVRTTSSNDITYANVIEHFCQQEGVADNCVSDILDAGRKSALFRKSGNEGNPLFRHADEETWIEFWKYMTIAYLVRNKKCKSITLSDFQLGKGLWFVLDEEHLPVFLRYLAQKKVVLVDPLPSSDDADCWKATRISVTRQGCRWLKRQNIFQ